jgi:hypothetical protein
MARILLAEALARGIRVEPHEAVAVSQQLMQQGAVTPAPGNVRLAADGTVECVGCDATPGVYEMAIFLQTLLPPERVGVPGGLRYAIARGLHEVDARPFDSIDELASALQRFEKGDRRIAVAQLVRRAVPGLRPAVALAPERPLPPPVLLPQGDSWWGAVAIAAALVICALIGFTTVRWVTTEVRGTAVQFELSRPAAPAAQRTELPSAAHAARPGDRGASARARRVRRTALRGSTADSVVVAAIDSQQRSVFSPAFASNGSARFLRAGGARGDRSAITPPAAPDYDFEVMTIVDEGARNYHVQPSPDGRSIAFDSDRDGERGIYLAKRDGSEVRRISGDGYAAMPTWSPDGRRLAYIRAEPSNPQVWNLWIQSLDDGRIERLTSYRSGQTWSASWFPDGDRICYSHDDTLVLANLNTGREEIVDSPVRGRIVRTPSVSPDGSKVIFQVFGGGAWMLNIADDSMTCVITDPTAEEFAWSPDGRRVAFHSRRDAAWGVYVIAG